ncbi:MAG: hypothetical protein COV72_09140 [Candidatus Omnitrophica bacterium CG11_big_fil_rev_8_21_14_0_20_42_13]|uniref:Poly A polymerase head domain-containing protein n=1 Tax=Candidatus Ghiorseimicrobium undicola TaxID=1974746 RepID=A0A2H0LV96_9BACT|nr:MAG: hypothetical protein COV72_09140 [Candidatus Omnitrophica bacterium CG11_big_fil_rev_8_21_14_0_20_42_13]
MNLKNKIKKLPKDILSIIEKSGALADEMSVSVYVVGGFVRDVLLGRPNLDVDIVVEGDGILFAENLKNILGGNLVKHIRFRTAVLSLENNLKVDIASSRSENYVSFGALPVVDKGTIRDDLFRRDFSINAMAAFINRHNFGYFLDYFKGRQDLKNKNIRVLHDLSFLEDATRMLRALRFEQRYGFRMEKHTRQLFAEAARRKMLDKISKHRVRDELILGLKEESPVKLLGRIDKLYGFSFICRGIKLTSSKKKFLKTIENTASSFCRDYPKKRALDAWLIIFIALLEGLDFKKIRKICHDFAFSKGDSRRILSFHEINKRIIKFLSRKRLKSSLVYQKFEPLSFEVIALIAAKVRSKIARKRINEYLLLHNGIALAINGSHLKELGFVPGPHFKKMLTKVLHAKIDKVVKDQEGEINFIKKHGFASQEPKLRGKFR